MAIDHMTFRVHYKGEFGINKYLGGMEMTYKDVDLDYFSYSELMEWVKDLGFTEIGGIFVKNEENHDGWDLVTDDAELNGYIRASDDAELNLYIDCDFDANVPPMRQMQPHVIVKPRRLLVKPKTGNPKKRQFVTLKDINQEKERKKRGSRNKKDLSLKAQLMGFEASNKKDNVASTKVQETEVNEYEMLRTENIEKKKKKDRGTWVKQEQGKIGAKGKCQAQHPE